MLRLPQTFYLRIQGYYLIVDRPDYRPTHGCQGLIHINDQRIFRTTVRNQAVALQQLFVVFGNLRFNIGAFNAGIGRKQLGTVGVIGQIVPDVAGHVELVVQSQNLRIRLAALRHIHARSRLHVG